MTETNAERLESIDILKKYIDGAGVPTGILTEALQSVIEQAERTEELKKEVESSEGRAKWYSRRFDDGQVEKEQITDLLVQMRDTFTDDDRRAEGHEMDDAVSCPTAVAQYALNKLERAIEDNKRLKKALFVAFSHAIESQSDGTIDVITDTLQGLDFTEIWDKDYEEGKKIFGEWMN